MSLKCWTKPKIQTRNQKEIMSQRTSTSSCSIEVGLCITRSSLLAKPWSSSFRVCQQEASSTFAVMDLATSSCLQDVASSTTTKTCRQQSTKLLDSPMTLAVQRSIARLMKSSSKANLKIVMSHTSIYWPMELFGMSRKLLIWLQESAACNSVSIRSALDKERAKSWSSNVLSRDSATSTSSTTKKRLKNVLSQPSRRLDSIIKCFKMRYYLTKMAKRFRAPCLLMLNHFSKGTLSRCSACYHLARKLIRIVLRYSTPTQWLLKILKAKSCLSEAKVSFRTLSCVLLNWRKRRMTKKETSSNYNVTKAWIVKLT